MQIVHVILICFTSPLTNVCVVVITLVVPGSESHGGLKVETGAVPIHISALEGVATKKNVILSTLNVQYY